ncbi:hypothetical protein [Propionivibrio sp.]|uniref:hypothetical protein n=1 Tax=Propionivibrio sp. TaxID=2212460 RepID=UPI003BF2175E
MNRSGFTSSILGAMSFLALLGCTQSTLAARLVDVSVVNRNTGERLTPYRHDGKLYVAGTPGDRYSVELKSKRGERVLTVLSVDGINVLTGQTAATLQSGYVIDGGQSYGINGWRKSMDDVAQFVFTALPNSYAARTGRPGNVGVIGVAVYREKAVAPPPQPIAVEPYSPSTRTESARDAQNSPEREAPAAPAQSAKAESADSTKATLAGALAERRADQAESGSPSPAVIEKKAKRLGTGHGEREYSPTRYTEFVRNSDAPDEIVTIYYDSRANLIAQGIIPSPRPAEPTPFPSGAGFVPDPRG